MKRRFLLVFLVLSLMTLCLGGVACKKKENKRAEGPETGIYYFDDEGDEYLISLFDGDQFTFLVKEANRTGTYELSDTSLTLRFSKKEDGELKGTLSGKELKVTYEGRDLRFLKKEKYEVRFESNGGSAVSAIEAINGKTIKKPEDPTKSGSVFLGWYKEENFSTLFGFESEPVYGAMTLYARWAEKGTSVREYQIDFDLGDGAVEHAETVGGKVVEFPKAERAGYEFAGWFVSDYEEREKLTREISADETFEEDATVYAVWKQSVSGGKLNTPSVSVNGSRVYWTGDGNATGYQLVIQGPEGFTEINHPVGGTEEQVDFANFPAGDYIIKVTAVAASTSNNSDECVRYYKNKALKRPSGFEVAEPGALVFDPVEHAQKYLIYVECGNSEHRHDPFDNGNSTYFSFQNCEMKEGGITFRVEAIGEGYASSTSRVFTYERKLDRVENLKVDEGTETLSFAPVAKAAYYEIEINNEKVLTTKTSLSLREYPMGEIKVTVTPKTRGYLSPEASEVSFQKTRLPSPKGIAIESDTLTWDAVEGADGYSVRINTQIFDAETTEFDLTKFNDWDSAASFRLSVMAKSSGEDSLWSEEKDVNYYAMGRSLFYEGGEVYWNYVVGATSYEVRVNDNATQTVTKVNHKAITLTKAGENIISVRYLEGYVSSEWVSISVFAHTVTFDTLGGSNVPTKYFAKGDLIQLPDATSTSRQGYDLAGWYNVPGGAKNNGLLYNSDFYLESGDIVLYANWKNQSFEITLHSENGTDETKKASVTYGEHFTVDVPTNPDEIKAFAGFYAMQGGHGVQLTDEHGKSLATWATLSNTEEYYAYWVDVFTFTKLESGKWSVSKGPGVNYVTTITIPESYSGIDVEVVEGYAFMNCDNLLVTNIPDTIKTVESTAFEYCWNQEEINVYTTGHAVDPTYSSIDGVLLNKNDKSQLLEIAYVPLAKGGSYRIPDGVQNVPVWSFARTKITELFVPTSVTSIGQDAFFRCSYLRRIVFDQGGAAPLEIQTAAFKQCASLAEVSLPSRIQNFDRTAFDECTSLATISVEAGGGNYASVDGVLTTASGDTLLYCPIGRRGSFVLPSTITTIGAKAFQDCKSLRSVTFHANLKSIGESAFTGCSVLNTINFDSGSMVDLKIEKEAFKDDAALLIVNFAEDSRISEIGESAFAGCTALQSISLPKYLQTIGTSAFSGCTALSNINFAQDGVELTIGESAFEDCTGLREVKIPKNVVEIKGSAFAGCIYIQNILVEDTNGNYADQDGVLFNHELTEILFYPRGKGNEYTIPDTVTTLSSGVFSGNRQLSKITIGDHVAKIGADAFNGCTGLTDVEIKDGETELTIEAGAFAGCTGLTKIELPGRLKNIPDSLFDGCSALSEVTLEEGIESIGKKAFKTTILKSIEIPGSVKEIGSEAFANITNLETVTLNEGLEKIGAKAFQSNTGASATKLSSITIPKSVKAIDSDAFQYCANLATVTFEEGGTDELVLGDKGDGSRAGYTFAYTGITSLTLPNRLKNLGDRCFFSCTKLTKVDFENKTRDASIPETSLEFINQYAFGSCSALASAVIPEGVETIDGNAFEKCALTSVTIPKSVKNTDSKVAIGNKAFADNKSLTTVTFEKGANAEDKLTLGDNAFNGCEKLTSIELPARLSGWGEGKTAKEGIGSNCFGGCPQLKELNVEEGCEAYCRDGNFLLANNKTRLISCALSASGKITVPETVNKIDASAFAGCTEITEVEFKAAVENVPANLFQGCTKLTKVSFQDGVLSIGDGAFQGCTALTSVTPLAKVKTIGANAFNGCTSITKLSGLKELTALGNAAFANCTSLTGLENIDKLETIGDQVFNGCTKLTEFTCPNSLKQLGAGTGYWTMSTGAFMDSGLKKITLNKGLTQIGTRTFTGCKELKEVKIPGTVTILGQKAFSDCPELSKVEFEDGESPLTISSMTFQNCPKLKSVTLPKNLGTVQSNAFYDTLTEATVSGFNDTIAATLSQLSGLTSVKGKGDYTDESGVLFTSGKKELLFYPRAKEDKNYTIPSGVTSIGASAFKSNSKLTSITIPNSVTSIGKEAFYMATGLTTITFNSGNDGAALTIDYQAFYSAWISELKFPKRLQTIGERAFYNAGNIKTIDFGTDSNLQTIGVYAFRGNTSLTSIKIPKNVTTINAQAFKSCSKLAKVEFEGNAITKLDKEVFADCTALNEINVPTTVTEFGESALSGTAITEAKFNENVSAIPASMFKNCKALTKVELPGNVRTIGAEAFSGCSSLTQLTIPGSVTSIGQKAFFGCAGFTRIDIPDAVTDLNSATSLFEGCTNLETVKLPNNLTALPSGIFSGCTKLGKVEVPAMVEKIGDNAFKGAGLTEFTIPASCTTLGVSAFENCTSLTSITIPEGVQKIDKSAFKGCSGLTNVDIRDGLQTIEGGAFQNCTKLASFNLPGTVIEIGSAPFAGCEQLETLGIAADSTNYTVQDGVLYNSLMSDILLYPAGREDNYNMPESVTTIAAGAFAGTKIASIVFNKTLDAIPDEAFKDCTNLTTVTFTDALLSIGKDAFRGCTNLTNLQFAKKLETIGDGAFAEIGITELTIPASVRKIDKNAFSGCKSLKSIDFETGETVLSIGDAAFKDCSELTSVKLPYRLRVDERTSPLGKEVFANDTSLTSVTFEEEKEGTSITKPLTLGASMFAGCTALEKIEFPKYLADYYETWDEVGHTTQVAFIRALGDSYTFQGCTSLTGITFQHSEGQTITLADGCFQGCTSLTEFEIPEFMRYDHLEMLSNKVGASLTHLFDGCTSLTKVTLPEELTFIGNFMFAGCSSLTEVEIKGQITTIGKQAFDGCTDIETLTIKGAVTYVDQLAFKGWTESQKIVFSDTSKDAPTAGTTKWSANWNLNCSAQITWKDGESNN